MAVPGDASAILETPGTVLLFQHQIGLLGSVRLRRGAERMLRS